MGFWEKFSGRNNEYSKSHEWHEAIAGNIQELTIPIARASIYDRTYLSRDRYDSRRSSDLYYAEKIPVGDKEIIKACNIIYNTFGIARNTIDLMQEFASEGLDFRTNNEKIKKFYLGWAEAINLQEVIDWIFLEFYKSGNVVIFKNTKQLTSNEIENLTKFTAEADRPKKIFKAREIPVSYTVLDPLLIDKVTSAVFNDYIIKFTLPTDLQRTISNPRTDKEKIISQQIKQLMGDKKSGNQIELDPNRTTIIHRKKQPYEKWAKPFLYAILDDIYYRNKLRMMDKAAADSIINAIVLLKVGNDKFPASPDTVRKVAEMLCMESKSMYFVWNHAIELESDYAPVGDILGEQKYETVNKDILRGMGISDVILGGMGTGNYATSYLSVRTLLERLEDGRNKVIRWLREEMKQIAEAMDFDEIPEVEFAHMSLKDEAAESEIIIRAYERNIISPRSAIDALRGRQLPTFEEEITRMEELNDLQDRGLFIKPQQIQAGGGVPLSLMGLPKDEEEPIIKKPKKMTKTIKESGRPSNQPITKKIPERKVTPKGASVIDLIDDANINLDKADKIYDTIKKNVGKDISQQNIFYIFSHILNGEETDSIINKTKWLSNKTKIFADKKILKAFTKLLERWKKNNPKKAPDKSILEKLWKNAWSIVRAYDKFVAEVES